MKRVRKKNILDRIDDSINDKIDEIKSKKKDNVKNDNSDIFDYDLVAEKDEETESKPNKKIKDKKASSNPIFKKKVKDSKKEIAEDDDAETKPAKKKKLLFNFSKKDKVKKIKNEDILADEDEDLEEEKKETKTDKKKKVIFGFAKKDKKISKKEAIVEETTDEDIEEDVEEMTKKKKKKKLPKEKKVNKKEKVKKKKKRSFWKKLLTFILIMGILGVLALTAFLGYIVVTCPEYNESALAIQDQTVVYDMNGSIIAKLGTEKRESITYDDLPEVLIDAIIATEDSRFFQHNGVDLFRFIKATIQQLLGQDDAGGASTLTMQTVKNNLTKKDTTETSATLQGKIKKVIRKFQDVYLAVFKVEKAHSKEEILEMYINDNGLGSSYYGVEEASKYYYGHGASELTLPEAALIAGLFQAPNRHNPYKDIESATKRRTIVLKLMESHGYITKEERELAEKISVESMLVGTAAEDNQFQGYIDTVVAEVERLTDPGDGTGGDNPYTVPMKIYTNMNRSMQTGINNIFKSNAAYIWKDDVVQGGIAIVNVETGALEAVGAGRNKTGVNQFNYATMAYRQPGSTAKPLFDYGPGIEYNNFSSYQLFNDEPWTYTNGPRVNNWDSGYYGLVTMRYALQVSRNIPALKAFQQVGVKNSQKFVSALGLNVSLNSSSENYEVFKSGLDNTINEAYAIGGAAEGFTPLDMAAAYACFANGGYYIEPHTVNKIVYRDTGEEIEYKYTKERVMKDSTAYIMNNILESAVTSGFNGGANVAGSHVAAKTGTSNYDEATMKAKGLPASAVNDLWTVAYTSKYSVAVWYGYDEVSKEHYNDWGGYKDHLMAEAIATIPKDPVGWTMPSSVVRVTVEKETWPAMLPSAYTPDNMKVTEYFVRGTQPTEVSPRYQKLDKVKNVTTTKVNGSSMTINWEFSLPKAETDSYLNSYFSNSVYGNEKNKYLNKRKEYNKNTLGEIEYVISKKNADGSLTELAKTNKTTYTYTGYGDATLVIVARHSKFTSTASDSVSINVKLDELKKEKLNLVLNGQTSPQLNVGTYAELGIKSVTYGTTNIFTSDDLTLEYIVSVDSETHKFTELTEVETYVNTLPAGTYQINYNASYLGLNVTKTRSITLR